MIGHLDSDLPNDLIPAFRLKANGHIYVSWRSSVEGAEEEVLKIVRDATTTASQLLVRSNSSSVNKVEICLQSHDHHPQVILEFNGRRAN